MKNTRFIGLAIMLLMMYDFKNHFAINLLFIIGYAMAVWGHYFEKDNCCK